jgi:hypothetical protein
MSLFSGLGSAIFGVPPVSAQPYEDEAQKLQQGAGQYAGQEQSAYDAQQQLADSLWNTINGRGPSVADIRLQQALDQGLAQTTAAGAGATGTNAVLARYLAATANGNQAAQAAQAGGLLRAQEAANAQNQLGNVTANQANEGAGMYGRNLDTGLGYAKVANDVNQANAQRQQTAENALLGAATGLPGALGSLGAMYFKGGGGGGSGGSGGGSGLSSSDPATSNAAWDAYDGGVFGSSNPRTSNAAWAGYGG